MVAAQKTTFITIEINTGTKSEIAYGSNFSVLQWFQLIVKIVTHS